MRTASARVKAATKAGARPRHGGVSTAAAAMNRASRRTRTTAPYQLKARAHIEAEAVAAEAGQPPRPQPGPSRSPASRQ